MNLLRESLRGKVLISLCSLVVLAFGLSGVINYWQTKKAVDASIQERVTDMAKAQADKIDTWLVSQKNQVVLLSMLPGLGDGPISEDVELIKTFAAKMPEFDSFFIADQQANYYATSGATGSIADRPYFKPAITGQTVFSDPLIARATGNAVVVIATPIRDTSGNITRILGGNLKLGSLSQEIVEMKASPNGYGVLVHKDGLVIAHPNEKLVMKANFLTEPEHGLQSLMQLVSQSDSGHQDYTINGEAKTAGFSKVKSTGWYLLATVPYSDFARTLHQISRSTLIVFALALVILLVSVSLLLGQLLKPLALVVKGGQLMATGDLTNTVTVHSQDEAGQLAEIFNQVASNMRNIIRKIGQTSEQLTELSRKLNDSAANMEASSDQLATTIAQLADKVAQDAENAQKAEQAVEQANRSVAEVSRASSLVAERAGKSSESVGKGLDAVQLLISKIEENSAVNQQASEAVMDMANQSRQVSDIVNAIATIASQTNLLALNAAIEAARAGEYGRGFAVVADEVRKLAEQSADEATKISKIIDQMNTAIKVSVDQMLKARETSEQQVRFADDVLQAFTEIEDQVKQVVDLSTRQVGLSRELVEYSNTIVTSVGEIAASAQEEAASAEEVSAATEEQSAAATQLSEMSRQLTQLATELEVQMGYFKV
ncbi:MAG: methyl-accepting chemotaxis protein [Syntrophothermus sp.]|uniref:methyl-accepting chemotaxis protein n=1 Tax=Syntrophothermus sp. TaxID=2736299 RepID=UPI00257A71B1|nr:methyl-accepting chemotaxis protein [Syntrophothermus sp.]NSW83799.1 methyl-accepting chemotaxis protein [Syntrophothermus sp.]